MNAIKVWLLRWMLRSRSLQSRRKALEQLRTWNQPEAVGLLALALCDAEDEIAGEAADLLAERRAPAALEALTAAIQNDLLQRSIPGGTSRQWRFERWVKALADYGPAATAGLIAVVRNRDTEVAAHGEDFEGSGAIAAMEALGKLANPVALATLSERLAEPGLGYDAARVIAGFGTAGESLLIAMLKDTRTTARRHAAFRLAAMRSARSAPSLHALLADADAEVRGTAASALGDIGDAKAIDELVPMLHDLDPTVRVRAATALERLSWRPDNTHDCDRLAIAKGELHPAATQGPRAIRPLLRELAGRYGFEGMAKKDDALAMKQIGWAMRDKKRESLPMLESLLPIVRALERILEEDSPSIPTADARMLKHLPDLRVQHMSQITREDYGSGLEYTEDVLAETALKCDRVRSLAERHVV